MTAKMDVAAIADKYIARDGGAPPTQQKPKDGEKFPVEDRAALLRALAATFDVIYGEDAHVSIEAEARTE